MNRIFILLFSLASTQLFAQYNFQVSKSLSENFSDELVTIAEENGNVYLYDLVYMQLVKYDVANDKYASTDKNFFKEAGVIEPHSRFDQIEFLTDDYLVLCYFNSGFEKGKNSSVFVLYFDKNTMKFEKKVVHSFNMYEYKNNVTSGFNFDVSENRKYVSIQYKDIGDKNSVRKEEDSRHKFLLLDVENGNITEIEDGSYLANVERDKNRTSFYVKTHVSNSGSIYSLIVNRESYTTSKQTIFYYGDDKDKDDSKPYYREFVKFSKDEDPISHEIKTDILNLELISTWNEATQELYYIAFGFVGQREKYQKGVVNAYCYYKFDEDLELLNSTNEGTLDRDLIVEANQEIEFKELPDNSIGLISFNLKELQIINNTPVLIFDHQVVQGYRDKYAKLFYPSFLVVYLDEKGELEDYTLIKRWNSDQADPFGKKICDYRILNSKDAIYIISNYNSRFEPFKGEKEFENGQLAYCKITNENVGCANILEFKEANFFGVVNNQPFGVWAGLADLSNIQYNEGNYIMMFQQENKGNVPNDLKKYKYFYGNIKLK
ncbi:MAG: hypothetical protein R2836_06400 [Chitinophagales bacterium]